MLIKGEEGKKSVNLEMHRLDNGSIFRCNGNIYMVVQIYIGEEESYHTCYINVRTGLSENLERYREVEHLPWASIDPGDE